MGGAAKLVLLSPTPSPVPLLFFFLNLNFRVLSAPGSTLGELPSGVLVRYTEDYLMRRTFQLF